MELTLEEYYQHLFIWEQFQPLELRSKVVDLNIVYYGDLFNENPLMISNCYTYGCHDDSPILIGYLISCLTKLETYSNCSSFIDDFKWSLNVTSGTYFFTIKFVVNNKEYNITEIGNRVSHIMLKAYILFFQVKQKLRV